MGREASLSALALVAAGIVIAPACGGTRRELLVVVDTDMVLGFDADADPTIATTASFDRLRIELLGAGESDAPSLTGDSARDLVIGPDTQWPLTFAIGEGDAGEDLARIDIRAWRTGNDLRGVNRAVGPSPALSIERLAIVPLPGSDKDTIRIVLRGECIGTPADHAAETTCVTSPAEMTSARDAVEHVSGIPPSERGTWSRAHTTSCTGSGPPDALCVGGGLYVRGDDAFEDVAAGLDLVSAGPRHVVAVKPFYLDRSEYSVARFRAALAKGTFTGVAIPRTLSGTEPECTWTTDPLTYEDLPLTCVELATARAACKADGGDLPTDAQWEYAARGPRVIGPYVWGTNDIHCCSAQVAISLGCHGRLGSIPSGTLADAACGVSDLTAAGVAGLAGNVRELVLDAAVGYASPACAHASILDDPMCTDPSSTSVARGGSWRSTLDGAKIGARTIAIAGDDLGFRCAYPGSP